MLSLSFSESTGSISPLRVRLGGVDPGSGRNFQTERTPRKTRTPHAQPRIACNFQTERTPHAQPTSPKWTCSGTWVGHLGRAWASTSFSGPGPGPRSPVDKGVIPAFFNSYRFANPAEALRGFEVTRLRGFPLGYRAEVLKRKENFICIFIFIFRGGTFAYIHTGIHDRFEVHWCRK